MQQDRETIIQMLRDIESMLSMILENPTGWVPKELVDHFHEVKPVVPTTTERLIGELSEGVVPGRFESPDAMDAALAARGLTHMQLDLKRVVMAQAKSAYDRVREAADNVKRKVLRGFFRISNSFLGSLSGVLPGAEILKEIKESVETGMDLADME